MKGIAIASTANQKNGRHDRSNIRTYSNQQSEVGGEILKSSERVSEGDQSNVAKDINQLTALRIW